MRALGAKGDGATDDSAAFQTALDALAKTSAGGAILAPAGRYRIARPLLLRGARRVAILGQGLVTRLQMEADEPLLRSEATTTVEKFVMSDLTVESIGKPKSLGTFAIAMEGGMAGCTFENVWFDGQRVPLGGSVRIRTLADTSAFMNCVSWGTTGTAIEIGVAAEVRIVGGRIIGQLDQKEGGVGVHLTGNAGGIHILTTDIIGHHTGLLLGNPPPGSRPEGGPPAPGNREIFLTQATFDSCVYGVRQWDSSYVSVAGLWAASSDEAQIVLEETAKGALFVVAGGTIFNGGAYGRKGAKNGFVAKAGAFNLSGVDIRNNQGTGLVVGPGAKDWMVTGCRIHDNGTATRIEGNARRMMANNLTFDNPPRRR